MQNINIKIVVYLSAILVCNYCSLLISKEKADIIVAKDGSGKFSKIQDAIDSVPADNRRNVIILISKGIYHEKLFITKSHITLVGEDRDSTRIVYAELRKNVNKTPMDMSRDWGTAVINIDSSVTDITLANLTVYNNYGSLYGDHDHQFAVRGGGTRVIIINCNIIADGGDTLSLWNKKDGMYYHSNCYFEGWVDFVCPRGWCYITDSKFYGHNKSASIWHDGSTNKDQKFVIRYSSFDGIPNFPLGRHHRDGQFYLLDCIFSRNMADRPIYYPSSPTSVPWQWGERHYYYNCHREGGDFDWFKNNLETADSSPKPGNVTPKWVFGGKWDPENSIPSVLPKVFLLSPRDGAYRIPVEGTMLRWVPSRNAKSQNLYFGKSDSLKFIGNIKDSFFAAGKIDPKTTYTWRIDEIIDADTIKGTPWHFMTE